MSLIKSNFEALQHQYGSPPSVVYVDKVLTTYSLPKLLSLLDHHSNRTYYNDDVERRAAFDDVLEYYSLMEVAAIASYIPADFPPAYTREALAKLEQPAVRKYYEKNYKLLLPQLHRKRLRGQWRARERGGLLPAKFIAFTQMSKALTDDDVAMFLSFLEDITIGGESLDDVEKCVRDPEQFAAAFMPAQTNDFLDLDEVWRKLDDPEALRDPSRLARELDRSQSPELSPTQRGVRGFRKFLFFCRDFHDLLETLGAWPLTQSAMWHHHAYWLGEMRAICRSRCAGRCSSSWPGMLMIVSAARARCATPR